jgi:hypothetical protein
MRGLVTGLAVIVMALAMTATAIASDADAGDGTVRGMLQDPFLDKLAGDWRITRSIRGTVVHNTMHAEWVLEHQFLQVHMRDVASPPAYEAIVLIGFDASQDRYVAHWTDNFGGQYSAIGYGKRVGDSVEFEFAYPDGPFYNTFSWIPQDGSWRFRGESVDENGKRQLFADDTVQR